MCTNYMKFTSAPTRVTLDGQSIINVDPGEGGFWDFGGFDLPDESNPWVGGDKMAPFDQPVGSSTASNNLKSC